MTHFGFHGNHFKYILTIYLPWDQVLDKLSEKLNSRLLVQEEHGFQKGAQCAPLAAGAQKKPDLDKVKVTAFASFCSANLGCPSPR